MAPIQDGLFGFVIIANTAIGIVQELRAKQTLDSLAVIGEAAPDGAPGRPGREVVRPPQIVLDDLVELGPATRSWSTARSSRRTAWRSTSRC